MRNPPNSGRQGGKPGRLVELERSPMLDVLEDANGPSGPTEWMYAGACSGDANLFFAPFAERPEARVRREAKARVICQTCSVMMACRDYARHNRELGFWGGESEGERAEAGFPPTTPIIGRRRTAEKRAQKSLDARRVG